MKNLQMPWGETNKRIILIDQIGTESKPLKHPNGRKYFTPVIYKSYTMETNYNKERGLGIIKKLCNDLNISIKIIKK